MASYEYRHFPYIEPPELGGAAAKRHIVIIVGAGPVGLTAAIDLALHDVPVLVLDESDLVSVGSRAICWAKRTLEILDRLGVAERMLAKGVTWNLGRVYHRDQELYSFNLAPEGGHKMPAFINLQQYYVEEFLVARASELANRIELRWKNKVTGILARADGVELEIQTPGGSYRLEADWVIAADGGRSSIRGLLGLPFEGETFEERFLIADVHMQASFPNERWFWFEPPFHRGERGARTRTSARWESLPACGRRRSGTAPRTSRLRTAGPAGRGSSCARRPPRSPSRPPVDRTRRAFGSRAPRRPRGPKSR